MTRALLFIFIAATTISRSGFTTGEAVESDNLVWGATASEVVTKLKIVPSSDRQSFLEEGAKKEGTFALYSTMAQDHGTEVLAAFRHRYPFLSTELQRAGTTALVGRILGEARAGRYGVDVSNQPPETIFEISQVGLIEPYLSPNRVAVRKEMMDDKGLSTGAYHLVIVVAYNTKMVSKEELPKKYEELADRRWKGRFHVDPDDVDWFDSLAGYWGEKKAIAFMRQLSMLQPDLRIGKTLSAQLLGAGEFGIAPYLNGYRIAEMKAQGAPVDFLLMEPVFSKPRVVFLAKHAPHPHAAILFLDWIISEEAQTLIGQKLGRDPVRKGLKSKYERLDYAKYIVTRESLGPIYKKRLKQYHELIGYR
jgi:iron(III) transport system substrate-binding protein